jgi:hypothetical protein
MGEIILIVDSDTQVPEDCFRDAAREFAESPEVAILQHESDGESHSISSTLISTYRYSYAGCPPFLRERHHILYPAYQPLYLHACANGEVAPFVGHNA